MKFKKTIAIAAALAVITSCMPQITSVYGGAVVYAAETSASGFEYSENDDGGVIITRYNGNEETVVIPDKLGGKSVTGIGDFAFEYHNPQMKYVEIPSSVTSIGKCVFDSCDSLLSITVAADNKNYISDNGILFSKDKTQLIRYPEAKKDTSYVIPDSVTVIDTSAFEKCLSLTSVKIPEGVTSIGSCAFAFCSSLSSVNIPDTVTKLGTQVFGDTAITSVKIPQGVTYLDTYLFMGCTLLTNVELPDTLTSIGYETFSACDSLESIKIPASVTSIGTAAFAGVPDNFTIYGYEGSYAEKYAKEYDYKFLLESDSEPIITEPTVTEPIVTDPTVTEPTVTEPTITEPTVSESPSDQPNTQTDSATGITITADNLDGKTLSVVEQSSTSSTVSYNITLKDKDGNEVQPESSVTVKIPVPQGWSGDNCMVYRAETDGSYTDMNAEYKDGYMVFTTEHFSVYVLSTEPAGDGSQTAAPADTTAPSDTDNSSDKTDNNQNTGVMLSVVPAVMAAAAVIAVKKRK